MTPPIGGLGTDRRVAETETNCETDPPPALADPALERMAAIEPVRSAMVRFREVMA